MQPKKKQTSHQGTLLEACHQCGFGEVTSVSFKMPIIKYASCNSVRVLGAMAVLATVQIHSREKLVKG
jgi:hypothetical protein